MARKGLTRDRVVGAAFDLIDEVGLDAFSLRGVADRLKVTPMSLYAHVADREALLDGVTEELIRRAELPTEPMPWDEWVRTFAANMRRVARAHPEPFQLLLRRTINTVAAAMPILGLYQALQSGGINLQQAHTAAQVIFSITLSLAFAESQPAEPETGGRLLSELKTVRREDLPLLFELVDVALSDAPADMDAIGDMGVEVLIAGLRTTLSLT